jgi:hypothetical protein
MSIDPLKLEIPVVVPQPSQGQAAPKGAFQPVQEAGRGTPAPSDQVLLSGNQDRKFQELQLRKEQSNAAAGAIRNTDRALEHMGQKIDAMKAPLDAIVKNFPPFSAQDKARLKLMMNYASLRKEIEQLTIPRTPDAIKPLKAPELPAPLPLDAPDRQIADHIENLDATGVALNGMRAGLAADTASLLHDSAFSRFFSGPNGSETSRFTAPLTDSGASQKSVEVGRQFATVVSQGVTVDGSQFLKGLS